MDRVKDRIPTKKESSLLFVVCIFPIHVWAIIMFLYEAPAYLRRMPFWDVVGIFSYSQVVAFIESVLVLGFLIFVCISLPRRFFKDKFVAQGATLMFTTFIFMIPVHYQILILEVLEWNMGLYQVLVGLWIIIFLAALFGFSLLLRRRQRIEEGVINFVERLVVLSALYLVVDLLSFLIVIYRNVM